ncbi:MAG: hypothetical protein RLZZ458_3047 [Planctomycetota bacterium]|jgi:hypothetical protein
MTWQHFAAGLVVIFALALLCRRLPWFASRSSGCSGCNSCSHASSAQRTALVQLGMPTHVSDDRRRNLHAR